MSQDDPKTHPDSHPDRERPDTQAPRRDTADEAGSRRDGASRNGSGSGSGSSSGSGSGDGPISTDPAAPGAANLVYFLYLVAFVNGITALIGVVFAYISRDKAPAWLRSHYEFQIQTFWRGLIIGLVAFLLLFVLGIGVLVYLFLAIWWIVRCAKGLSAVSRREGMDETNHWGF